jgi:hypothetical protein
MRHVPALVPRGPSGHGRLQRHWHFEQSSLVHKLCSRDLHSVRQLHVGVQQFQQPLFELRCGVQLPTDWQRIKRHYGAVPVQQH